MKHINFDNVQEVTSFDKLEVGGYICSIMNVQDKPDKEYLELKFDIVEGKYKKYFTNLFKRFGNWSNTAVLRKSYKELALPFFKAFKTALEKSNPKYKYSDDEQDMVKRCIGVVFAEEEYINQKGEIKVRLYTAQVHSIDVIKNGEYTIPKLKKVKRNDTFTDDGEDIFTPVDDEDIPF